VAGSRRLDPLDVFALLDDEYARSIVAALSYRPMTAETLSDQCEMSLTTAYRRLNRLESCGFVTAETVVDPDGHHATRYDLAFESLELQVTDGEFRVSLSTESTTREYADTFTDLWEGL
jgi:predicted ArsR family transcriptional regulator